MMEVQSSNQRQVWTRISQSEASVVHDGGAIIQSEAGVDKNKPIRGQCKQVSANQKPYWSPYLSLRSPHSLTLGCSASASTWVSEAGLTS